MLTRRDLFSRSASAGAAAVALTAVSRLSGKRLFAAPTDEPPAAPSLRAAEDNLILNDVQSQLNATRVRQIAKIQTIDDVQRHIRNAKKQGLAISVSGGRHAMGGQQFGAETLHFDTRAFAKVLSFDADKGLVRVQGGIQWPELLTFLHGQQKGRPRVWSIRQKQTGVDRVSLAGSLSANAHGRGLQMQPIVDDVESIVLVGADGEARQCSRKENGELFSLAIGGYGLFGVIAEVTLRLVPRVPVRRTVEVIEVRNLLDKVQSRIGEGFQFGDCQYSTDFADLKQPHRGVFSCYKPVDHPGGLSEVARKLSAEDWTRLIYLGHIDKKKAFDTYAAYYLKTDGQMYWSDTHQLSNNFDGYHAVLDKQLGSQHKGCEMITEVYVRRERLLDFLQAARKAVHDYGINLIYGTIRFIERDEVTFLPWAKEQSTCVLCNLHVDHTEQGLKKAEDHARRLIQIAIDRGGRYFPTYHRWATRQQVLAAYPQLVDFLRLKRKYDPQERFQSEWYRHYREMFADASQ